MVRVSAGMVKGIEAGGLLSIRFLMFLKVFDSFVHAKAFTSLGSLHPFL
jgi:hypothetical protein